MESAGKKTTSAKGGKQANCVIVRKCVISAFASEWEKTQAANQCKARENTQDGMGRGGGGGGRETDVTREKIRILW